MNSRQRLALAAAAVAAVAGSMTVAPAGPASAAVTGTKVDFNGDGYADLLVSAPQAYVSGHARAGTVVALYGAADGLAQGIHTTISQDTPGVPGTAETGDGFGRASAIGDFNDDGYSDVAIATPHEKVGTDADGGTIAILWGSPDGLTGGTTVNDPVRNDHDRWGQALAGGDFNGDGVDDLAIGASGSMVFVFHGPITSSGPAGARYAFSTPIAGGGDYGVLRLTAGDVNGDGTADLVAGGYATLDDHEPAANFYFSGRAGGLGPGAVKLPDGTDSRIGDFDGDSYGDIAIGQPADPGSGEPGAYEGGKVTVVHGAADGPGGSTVVSQDTGAVPGTSESGDAFGTAVAVGDIDGDGFQDLAIGAPGEDIDGVRNAGAVTVLRGSASGLDTTSRVQYFQQNTPGVPGSNEPDDVFGADLHLDDTDHDGTADLTIGATGENHRNGALTALRSDGSGLTTAGALRLSASSLSVFTTGTPGLGSPIAD